MRANDAFLIGVDLGTTNCKVLAWDACGRVLHVAAGRTPLCETGVGWECDPEALWSIAIGLVREAVRALPSPAALRALAVASVGEAGVPIARDGCPVYPMIAWFDQRSAAQAEALEARLGEHRLYEITGLPSQPIHTVHKLVWLREHAPDRFDRIWRWCFAADYVAWRMSGAWATDVSLACRSRMFDVRRGVWSADILDAAGIPASILPPVVASGTLIGRVHAGLAAELGIPPATAVVTGGHDHICAAFASGVTEPGDILDSIGTAEALLAATASAPLSEVTAGAGFAMGCHVVPKRFYLLGGITMSGGAVDWSTHLLGRPPADLMDLAAHVAPGADGLYFVPHLRGSLSLPADPAAKGAFLGLRDIHHAGHVMRAVLEGLACEAGVNVQALEHITGRAGAMRVTGGGVHNRLWLDIKAAVFDRPLEILATTECTALGAAMLAGVGAGVFDTPADAMQAGVLIGSRVEPDPALADVMRRRLRIHRELYPSVAGLHRRLCDETSGRGRGTGPNPNTGV
jgi:xylulokinase